MRQATEEIVVVDGTVTAKLAVVPAVTVAVVVAMVGSLELVLLAESTSNW